MTGIQLQLGVPSAAAAEAGKEGDEAFEELFVLYGHGNSDKDQMSCEYMRLAESEYVQTMEIRYSKTDGIKSIYFKSSKAQTLSMGSVTSTSEIGRASCRERV